MKGLIEAWKSEIVFVGLFSVLVGILIVVVANFGH
ncbi:hypothetical protein BJQ93_02879 [Bacillus subtilis]|nr:hypothetical protein [Bacillus subtilis]